MSSIAILHPVKRDKYDFVDKETGEAVSIARYVVFVSMPGQEDFPVQTNIKDEGQFEIGKRYSADALFLANPKFGIKTEFSNIRLFHNPAAVKP